MQASRSEMLTRYHRARMSGFRGIPDVAKADRHGER